MNLETAQLKITAWGIIALGLAVWVTIPNNAWSAETNGPTVTPPPSPAMATPVDAATTLSLSIDQAILMALENNQALKIEKINPRIQQTYEDLARGAFDPVITGEIDYTRTEAPASQFAEPYIPDTDSGSLGFDVGLSQRWPTGTQISANLDMYHAWSDLYSDRYRTRAGVSVIQALLKGRPLRVNLASLRQAGIQTRISYYELRGFTETLLATVEERYWEYALSQNQVAIFKDSLALADIQLQQTREMIRVGRLAETELVAGQAERALRRQDLIQAQSTMEIARLQLLQALNPPGPDIWDKDIRLLTEPVEPDVVLADVNEHIALALEKRADLNQARLLTRKGELEVVKTRNGLLPEMDFFITLGKTGYADSFGGSVADLKGDGYDAAAGLSFTYPLKNRSARAQYQRSKMSLEQAREAVTNLTLLAQLDIHLAYIRIGRARQQIDASKATRLLQEERVRIETEKFRVGRSTNFMVAQAQRDLVRSRISEIEAVADYLISLTQLHRLEGSLLERRGIDLDGH